MIARAEVRLEIGGRYKMRNGNSVVVTGMSGMRYWPFEGHEIGDEGHPMQWEPDGKFGWGADCFDIISEDQP